MFPTILLERNRELVGFFATQNRNEQIVAGPLLVTTPRSLARGRDVARLVEAYEQVLRSVGVTRYIFHADSPEWTRAILKTGLYARLRGADKWFERNLRA